MESPAATCHACRVLRGGLGPATREAAQAERCLTHRDALSGAVVALRQHASARALVLKSTSTVTSTFMFMLTLFTSTFMFMLSVKTPSSAQG